MKKRIISFIFAAALLITVFCIPTAAVSERIRIDDNAYLFTSDEVTSLREKAEEFTNLTGFNIVILTSYDVGYDKTDPGVIDYADCYYDDCFGIDTDGILFLINMDNEYDIISTSGDCRKYFTDSRIDDMFDYFYDFIRDGNYYAGAWYFIDAAEQYYNRGIPSNEYIYDEDTGTVTFDNFGTALLGAIFSPAIIFSLIAAAIAMVITYTTNVHFYTRIKPYGKGAYFDSNSIRFTESLDSFVRQYTVTSNSSSGHSGGGFSSGRSSSHRSSSGGHHGGGGRHR